MVSPHFSLPQILHTVAQTTFLKHQYDHITASSKTGLTPTFRESSATSHRSLRDLASVYHSQYIPSPPSIPSQAEWLPTPGTLWTLASRISCMWPFPTTLTFPPQFAWLTLLILQVSLTITSSRKPSLIFQNWVRLPLCAPTILRLSSSKC